MDNEKIGSLIAEIRKSKNMTQREFADKLNITDKAVSKWERGLSLPDISILPELSIILEISIAELLNGEKAETLPKAESDTEEAVCATIEYAQKETKRKTKNIKAICSISISLSFFIGIIVCSICDLAITGTLSWSLFPISSITYAWLMSIPIFIWGKKGIAPSLLILSLLIIPFLKVLDSLIYTPNLIMPLGSKVALVSIVFVWIVYILIRTLSSRRLIAAAIITLTTIPLNIVINAIVSHYVHESSFNAGELITYYTLIVIAISLLVIDYLRKKR